MKLQGILGKGTGKLGNAVFAVSGGEQIMREYNPNVSNPNTEAQIAQRAKLKLVSQLAAVLAPAIGFAKMGLVSARNQFVSKNIGKTTYENNEAGIDLTDVEMTPSNVAFPGVVSSGGSAGAIAVGLETGAASDIKRVVYFAFEKAESNQLHYVTSKIVTEAGEGRTFPTTLNLPVGKVVVYAYGIKDNSVNATIRYEDYMSLQNDDDATLEVVALFRTSGYGLTKSSAAILTVR